MIYLHDYDVGSAREKRKLAEFFPEPRKHQLIFGGACMECGAQKKKLKDKKERKEERKEIQGMCQ